MGFCLRKGCSSIIGKVGVTFPDDLFYPVGVHTLGLIVMKGIPHPTNQKVLWVRAMRDGRLKKKGKRLENSRAQDDFPKIVPVLKKFIYDPKINVPSIPKFQKSEKIDLSDKDLELIPEAYLDEPVITTEILNESIEQLIRDNIAFQISFERQIQGKENDNY